MSTNKIRNKKDKSDIDRATTPKEDSSEYLKQGFAYDLSNKYLRDPSGSLNVQAVPSLVVAVIRLKYPDLYDYTQYKSSVPDGTSPNDNGYPVAIWGNILQIQKYCISAQVMSSKSSPAMVFNGVFTDPDNTMAHNILPGDWVVVWMTDNVEQATKISDNLNFNPPIPSNDFNSGLKFIGKVISSRKNISLGKNGEKIRRFLINASGFSEFNEHIYYDPSLIPNTVMDGFFRYIMGDLSAFNNEINAFKADDILKRLIKIFFGTGPTTSGSGQIQQSINSMFLVPSVIGGILNRDSASKAGGQLTYCDILSTITGIQQYRHTTRTNFSGFIPALSNDDSTLNQLQAHKPLKGQFFNNITPWNYVPIWQILNTFLNGTINEMYTTLRVSQDGNIVPFLIARQKPFSTNAFTKNNPTFLTTPYFSLPRWKIDPGTVISLDVGRSDALRINACQIIVHVPLPSADSIIYALQKAETPFIGDIVDVKRNGLRGSPESSNCLPTDYDISAFDHGTQSSDGPTKDDVSATSTHTQVNGDSDSIKGDYPIDVLGAIGAAAQKYNLSPRFIDAIIHVESGGDPNVFRVNKKGTDRGIMQINDFYHAAWFRNHDWHNINDNIDFGSSLLRQNLDAAASNKLSGDSALKFAASAYNAGVDGAKKGLSQGDSDLFTYSKNYGAQVLAYMGNSPVTSKTSSTTVTPSSSEPVASNGTIVWTQFKADQLMNGHLRYTGTLVVKGIQEPICIGDNLEFDNNIYHIEQVSHKMGVLANGAKTFLTELHLSFGSYMDAVSTHDLWPDLNVADTSTLEYTTMAGNFTEDDGT